MAQKVRFVDSVSVSAFGNTGPTSVISASAERKENKSVIKFTQANGNNFTVPIVASASAFDAVVSASVNLNQITFERGDETTFSIIVDTGSLSNEAFIESLTAAGISGSFNIASSSFSTRITTDEINLAALNSKTLLSSSAQISSNISGAFTAPSSSFSTRVSANEIVTSKTLLSSSVQIATEITGAFFTPSSSFSTRVSTLETSDSGLTSKTLVSSSAQIATEITGAFTAASSSFSTRVTSNEATVAKTLVSSSAQIADDISGSFVAASSSFSTRVTANETDLANFKSDTLISSSAQIAENISGSFIAASASFSTRVTNLKTDSGSFSTRVTTLEAGTSFTAAGISGAFAEPSSSFSTRVSSLEGGSGLKSGILSSSAQIAGDISGSFTSPSSSISTRLTSLEAGGDSDFTPAGISGSWQSQGFISASQVESNLPTGTLSSSAQIADDISGSFNAASSSFSTRVTANEATVAKTLVSSSAQIADNISGSFNAASSSFSTRITTNETNITNLTAETGSYVQFPFNGDAIITGSLDVSGSSNSRLIVKYDTNYDTFINGRLYLGGSDVTPRINFGSTNAATTLARGAGTSVTAFQWTFDNSLTSANHPGSFLRIYGSGSSFERGLNITQSNAIKGLGVSGSVEIVGPITASGNISASGHISASNLDISGSATINGPLTLTQANTSTSLTINNGTGTEISFPGALETNITSEGLFQFKTSNNQGYGFGVNNTDFKAVIGAEGLATTATTVIADTYNGRLILKGNANPNQISGSLAITGSAGVPGFISIDGNITASGDISASGALLFSSSLSDDTNLKTLMYNTTTGKIFHTGSYGGGGGGGFTPSLSTDLPAQNITASGDISASGHISASNLVLNNGSVASPAISFGTTNTGIFYNSGANSVAFAGSSATTAEFSNYILFRKYLSMNSNYIQNILYLSGPRLELRSTNGTITASAGISASGDISALDLNLFGGGLSIKNQGAQSYARFYCESSNAHYTELKAQPHALYSGNPVTLLPAYDFDFAKPNFIPPITASIISASSKFIGSELSSLDDLTLDADGADIILKDGGTAFGRFKRDSSDFIIKSETNNNDIIFKGQDGGSTITALTLDMSEGGKALFTGGVEITGSVSVSGSSFTIENSGSTIFEVIGSEGTIFSLEDSLSGSLFSVGDISGLPQFEVFSDGKIVGDEGVATLRTQRPIVTHTTDFNITSSLDFAGKYHIVGGNLTCSIDTGSLIPVGSEFEFFQTSSADNFLFETASHVDLIVKNDNLNLSGRGSGATLKYIAGSTFHLVGDLT